ncbi:GNAT family N-acetyltransferase [Hymenobacter caeli]|uniref:Arginine-tRNA-protein transferase n=1 Tax=Hymenobacter caeli TaxID=2735894 RepID=A0ABX2FQY8_9BACT|nr:GNAT family N-acetyltransferase [Hymenobacter caeli]NRT18951.1 arginine-tRNA-protein transferase [Hymenobacter caeli]
MPLVIPGAALDYYLGQGYYRMRQDLFTCQFLPHDGQLHTVHWLRVVLRDAQFGPKQRHLLRRNAAFSVAVRPFRLTAEYEELYSRYRESLDFEASETLAELLLADDTEHSVFNTEIVEVRDGDLLVAAGIFDQGVDSIAGIVNFYHPAYRQHSLGKYLMLLKIAHAQQQHKAYYYPGYVVHGYPKFDYKLWACPAATEVFDCYRHQWPLFSWEVMAQQSAAIVADWLAREGPDHAA